jgi:hypothetical protein
LPYALTGDEFRISHMQSELHAATRNLRSRPKCSFRQRRVAYIVPHNSKGRVQALAWAEVLLSQK